ncbi:hypothetical protein L345_16625, partial [Ophiophagus hannah]
MDSCKEFIQNQTENKKTWIGLKLKLPEAKFQPLTADCGIIGKKRIESDMCSTEHHWGKLSLIFVLMSLRTCGEFLVDLQ